MEGDEQRIPKDLLATCLGRIIQLHLGHFGECWDVRRIFIHEAPSGYMGIPQRDSQWISAQSPRFTASTASLQDEKLAEILCNLSGVLSLAVKHIVCDN